MNLIFTKSKMLNESKNEIEDNYETRESSISSESLVLQLEETLKAQVFLRIRPTLKPSESQNFNDAYKVEDCSTILVKPYSPNDAVRRSMITRLSGVPKKKFSFTKIFTPDADQRQFFDEAIKPSIVDFLNNQSTNVITYGTADSGKTYSLFGSTSNPGIIPRSIEFIYSSLNCTHEPRYKPQRFNSVTNLDECARLLEMEAREKLLSCRVIDKTICEEAYNNLKNYEPNKNREILNDLSDSVWISFVEIYNDTIYDMLEVDDEGKNMQLKIATDKHGSTYIHGMRSVCATTGLEAYEILSAGQTRLSTVSTSNYKSSRSHSIFTIKLLKYDQDCEPCEVKVSTISFCDLAGSGRIQKILHNEKQLKESRSINISLLALGRCLKVMGDGHSRYSTGPFRDSKLTRIFQRSLCGKENIILLININPSLDLFAETLNVLNFASSAMKLTTEREDKKLLEFQTPLSSPKSRESSLKITPNQEITEIILKNEQLLNELKEIKSVMLKREYEIRQELADKFTKQLSDLDKTWKARMSALKEEKDALLQCSVNRVENYYKEKLDEGSTRKRKKIDRGDHEDIGEVEELEKEKSRILSELESYKNSLENMNLQNSQLITQKNQYALQLSLVKDKLQKIAESASNPFNEANIEQLDCDSSDADKNDLFDNSFAEDLTSYMSIIKTFIKKSFKLQKELEQRKICYSKEVQCELNFTIVKELCKDIQELLEPRLVNLPEIDNSSDDSLEIYDQSDRNDDISITLFNVKTLIIDNLTKINNLKMENSNKIEELKMVQDKLEQQEREIVQMSLQYQESESQRLSLTKKIDNLKANLKLKELMANYNVYATEFDSFNFSEDLTISQNSSGNDSRLSFFTLDSDKNENTENRYSSESNKNDSGVASSIESALKISEHKSCQTTEDEKNNSFQERLWQLTLDYKEMKTQHLQESQRVNELSQELEHLSDEMSKVKENTTLKERTISEYKGKLISNQFEIERLSNERDHLEKRCFELTKELGDIKTDYEKKLTESQVKLKFHEEGESKTAKCLEDYWKKSFNLGNELSDAYLKLEKTSNQCFKEHILKIEMLEKELNVKKLNQKDLEQKLAMFQRDLVATKELADKVNNFENLVNRIQQEKFDLRILLNERTKNQSEIESQLHSLILKVEERDKQVVSLKTELNTVIKTNLLNSRKAKELGRDVARLMENICYVKESFIESETALKNLERSSNKEISNLRARLTIFEENAEILNSICDNHENKQSEIDKLRLRLLEREKELEFFKKNRKATIQRYECLVRQLQDALKMHNHSSKLKKMFCHKQKYFVSNSKECLHCDRRGSEPQMRDWKTFDEDDTYLLACANAHAIPASSPVRSTEFSKEEPNRLVSNSSEKSLESEKNRALVKIQHVPCKDVIPLHDCNSSSFLNDCLSIDRTHSSPKYHSNTRSYQEYY